MAKAYRPLLIPAGVDVKPEPGKLVIKGKLGTLEVVVPAGLTPKIAGGGLVVDAGPGIERVSVGTLRAHARNAILGVTQGYEKKLELRGMGYRIQKTTAGIQISCGYSHQVDFVPPKGVTLDLAQLPDPDDSKLQMFEVTVKGMDRHDVGQAAAKIREVKPPDVYQGKGIRYKTEHVRKKQGKRAASATA
jgi:large subunit ribosomal protein L6